MYAVDIFMGTYSGLARDTSRHPETLSKCACEAVTTEWLKHSTHWRLQFHKLLF